MMKNKKLFFDFLMLAASILFTFLLAKFDLILKLEQLVQHDYLLAFVTGIFFISFLTVVPATFVLSNLILHDNLLAISLVAGAGAMFGDLLIFWFVKDRLTNNFFNFLHPKKGGRWSRLQENKIFRFFLPVLGAAIIASPFPDEIGVTLLGASRMKKRYFIPMTYLLNTVGIYLVLLASRAL